MSQVMTSTEAYPLETSFQEQNTRLVGFCSRMVGNRQAAEDIAQEVFLRAHQAGHSEPAWLFVSARNLCIDYLRRRGLWMRLRERLGKSRGFSAGFEADLVEQDLGWRVLGRLSVKARSLILLQAYAGLTYQELAEAFGTTASSIAVMLHRARAQAAREIEKEECR